MATKIIIDALTRDSVSIVIAKAVHVDGVEYAIGDTHRCSYSNSITGRRDLTENIGEPYISSILGIWGEEPTITSEE